jgi:hypothetical protein
MWRHAVLDPARASQDGVVEQKGCLAAALDRGAATAGEAMKQSSKVKARAPQQTLIAGLRPFTTALLLSTALCSSVAAQDQRANLPPPTREAGELETAFLNPPAQARPRVWWHWMNGNITKDGIHKDLEWMKRVGIGGFQNFDANIATPQIVDKRLAFMTPEWKDAFRFAASEADRLGLEMAIASSPGFSVTGGPWVKPEDAMKKIAWSETVVQGGRAFRGKLARPPETTGPFQDASAEDLLGALGGGKATSSIYRDSLVFAYRTPAVSQPLAVRASIAGKPLDAKLLSDGSYATGLLVPKGSPETPTIIDLTLDKPQPVRSITIATRRGFQFFKPGITLPRLEASTDGKTWRRIADLPPGAVPTTISFAPIDTKYFRMVLNTFGGAGGYGISGVAAGFDTSVYDDFKRSPDFELLEVRLSGDAKIDRWEAKAGFTSGATRAGDSLDAKERGVAASDVIDLTGKLADDGALNWTPPPGVWRVVRMGWSLLGTTNHPATPEATGLEVDKIDGAAVRRYLETYLQMYRDAAGADLIGERGVQALLTDSTEAGSFIWTPRLLEHFQRLRGYDPRPWLPTLTGAIVETRERSDSFLRDFRRTLGDLYATEHYGTVAKVALENGLKVYGESLEGAGSGPGDDLDMRRYADIPMAAQWTFGPNDKPYGPTVADQLGAASVGHFYGKNIVAAESLTSIGTPWADAPADLRRTIDFIFANGINRPVIHTSVHVPRDDKIPGLSLWVHGQYFNRTETWAEMARPWVDYISRSSAMLQAGRPVADVAYFYGEESPIGAMSSGGLPADLPKHHAFDFISAKAVSEDLKVDGRDLVAPSGLRYRALQLGGSSDRITLQTLRRIAWLAEQGATIVGDAPKGSPGLEAGGRDYDQLVEKLWAGGEVTQVGKGQVIAGRDVEKALGRIGAAPDFMVTAAAEPDVRFVHRKIADGDIYFVTRRGKQAGTLEARFRVTGKAPEIWRADDATIKPSSYRIEGDQTVVPLEMRAEDSVFVVFRHDATAPSRTVATETTSVIADLQGPWNVAFQPGRGAPVSTTLTTLGSLSERPEPGIKYFSGVATYTRTIDAPRSWAPGRPLLIDLGAIGDVAEVRVNGQLAGAAWQAPYRVDISRFMKRGRNQLDIRVANLWVNRLIGDQQPGATRIAYTATPTYTPNAPLRPSGLIGPVRLLTTDLPRQ